MFGIFLFLTYYLQTILGYSPVATGLAFLPTIAMVMLFSQVANVILMPRIGPKLLVGIGMLLAAAGMMWLTQIGVHSNYASAILGPLLVTGAGIGLSLPPSMNMGTFGVAPQDAGVASATLNVGQQLGGSIGTALLNTIATSATASYLVGLHLSAPVLASPRGRRSWRLPPSMGTQLPSGGPLASSRAVPLFAARCCGPLTRQTETQIGVPVGQPQTDPSVPA